MAICANACAVSTPPQYTAGCGVVTRGGGVSRLAFISCDYEFADVSDLGEWATAIANGKVSLSGAVLGQKPKGSATKKRLSSCTPEGVIGMERAITFQDYNADPNFDDPGSPTYRDHAFWNTILQNSAKFKLGFFTCDGRFYGIFNDFTLEVDLVIPEVSTDAMYWEGSIAFAGLSLPAPIKLDPSSL